MKKVEEKDGKLFIDGVEYIKKEVKEQFYGVDADLIKRICDKLVDYGSMHLYLNGVCYPIGRKEFIAIKQLVKIGLEKSKEDHKINFNDFNKWFEHNYDE